MAPKYYNNTTSINFVNGLNASRNRPSAFFALHINTCEEDFAVISKCVI